MDYSLLKYPRKSHRKTIRITQKSKGLAELFGIIFGDGGINNDWQLVISLNSYSDLKYSSYIKGLLERLFAIKVAARKRPNQNTLVLVCSSSNLVNFLVKNGAVRGNKVVQKIDIPDWINNNSEKLIISVAKILKKFGINPHITDKGRRIYLYSSKAVSNYLDIFGSSNNRILKNIQNGSILKEITKKYKNFILERCESGLIGTLGKRVRRQNLRGFESPSLRYNFYRMTKVLFISLWLSTTTRKI